MMLIDSTWYIEALRRGVDPIVELAGRAAQGELLSCGIIRVEVLRGIVKPLIRDRLAAFFDVIHSTVMDDGFWSDTAGLAWELDRKGIVLPLSDLAIAVSAMRFKAVIVTSDGHFKRIPGLKVMDSMSAIS